jgi:hypothetical protein
MSNPDYGVYFQVYIDRLAEYLGTSTDNVIKILPAGSKEQERYKGSPRNFFGFFKDTDEVDQFLKTMSELKHKAAVGGQRSAKD